MWSPFSTFREGFHVILSLATAKFDFSPKLRSEDSAAVFQMRFASASSIQPQGPFIEEISLRNG